MERECCLKALAEMLRIKGGFRPLSMSVAHGKIWYRL